MTRTMNILKFWLSCLWAGAPVVFGEQTSNSGFPVQRAGPYSLVNPTPVSLMREFETDRPDTTESPRTVPAGHFQAEFSIIDYSRSSAGGVAVRTELYGACNLKMGLLDNVDLQFVFDAYGRQTEALPGGNNVEKVNGDLTLRLKLNLWGNDAGGSAMAFFPYVRFPSDIDSGGNRLEGGLILPYSVELDDGRSLGLMAQFDLENEASGNGYEISVLHSVVLGTPLGSQWANYLEYFGITDRRYEAYFSAGFTFSPVSDLQYDIGFRVGLNKHAEDFGVFSGVSFRY